MAKQHYDTESIGTWACYVCNKATNRVLYISSDHPDRKLREIAEEFICGDCLVNKIVKGELILSSPGFGGQYTAPPATTVNSVTLPVTTNDDGSIKVGDVEVRWD